MNSMELHEKRCNFGSSITITTTIPTTAAMTTVTITTTSVTTTIWPHHTLRQILPFIFLQYPAEPGPVLQPSFELIQKPSFSPKVENPFGRWPFH